MTTNANGPTAGSNRPVKNTFKQGTDFSPVSTGATSFAAYLGHHTLAADESSSQCQGFHHRARFLFGLPQVVGALHSKPQLGTRAKQRRQAQCHVGADGGALVDDFGQSFARNMQLDGRSSDAQTKRFKPQFTQYRPRMRGVVHTVHIASLVIVLVIDDVGITALHGECHAPIGLHRDRPMPLELPFELVQAQRRGIHVLHLPRLIKHGKDVCQPLGVHTLYPTGLASMEKRLQPLVCKALYHAEIVTLRVTDYNQPLTVATGHFCTETARVQQQTDAEWLAEYDAADPLVKPPVSGIVGAKAKAPVIRTTLNTAVYSPTEESGVLLCPNSGAGRGVPMAQHNGCGLGAMVRKAIDVAVFTVLTPSPPDAIRTVSSGFSVHTGTGTMFVNDQTCPATGHTTPTPTQTTGTPYTSLSFVKVEHKGKRKQRLTTWFAVPDQDYGTGNATGYRVAAELMSWLHTRPATFNTEHVTREVMAAAVKALEEPFQHGKPNKRGAAVSFMAAMAGFIHFAARHSNHDVYLPAKVQQLKDWARETAEIESERNRAIGQRLAAARKAKRAARQAESEAKAMKAGAA